MKLISWNVNGLRSCVAKGFLDYFRSAGADAFCVQETKLQEGQLELDLPAGYRAYWNCAERKGYSGTAVFTRLEPLAVRKGLSDGNDPEGRVQTLEFPSFYLVNVYTPNARRDLSRLDYRIAWEAEFRAYLKELDARKPVVVCGDLNVAHREIDLKNAKSNRGNAGFTDEEREAMTRLLAAGSSIRFATSIRTGRTRTPGGRSCRGCASGTSAGGSTISSSRADSRRIWRMRKSRAMSWAATIARSSF